MSKVTLEYIISPQRGVCPHWKMRFMQSLVKVGPIVLEKKMEMWNNDIDNKNEQNQLN